uniref:Uncharacterized protein n=1 Tax=Hippocampus comes TaxID=109280 RepID=A0A3Q3D5F6_HIPCM
KCNHKRPNGVFKLSAVQPHWPPSPLLLCEDEFAQVGVQFVLLVDALLLDAVPTLLLGDAQGAGDVVAEIQPLFFCQVVRCRKQNVRVLTVSQSLVMLLQLHMAEGPVGVVHFQRYFTHNGLAVAGRSLLILAAKEQAVPLLLQLLRGGTLLRAAGHLLHRLRLALLPNPVPRLSGWLNRQAQESPVPAWISNTVHPKDGMRVRSCNATAMRASFFFPHTSNEADFLDISLTGS